MPVNSTPVFELCNADRLPLSFVGGAIAKLGRLLKVPNMCDSRRETKKKNMHMTGKPRTG